MVTNMRVLGIEPSVYLALLTNRDKTYSNREPANKLIEILFEIVTEEKNTLKDSMRPNMTTNQ
jgi:hypothetical protein